MFFCWFVSLFVWFVGCSLVSCCGFIRKVIHGAPCVFARDRDRRPGGSWGRVDLANQTSCSRMP